MGLLSRKEQQPRVSTSPCAHLRAAYHDCFNRWYSEKYLKGQWDKEECVSEWGKYRACLVAFYSRVQEGCLEWKLYSWSLC
ncbi:uncharacterized protein At4g33100 isoform X4 [Amborella trichopoda]|uniref:uncharacterized protein At4g33100 isoform X4 n=1 Tax=Amborella trichopoda TaxID=13333 RepID=UPI0009BD05C1|nr:uncharacterized protein At4g33100 isoform X4 [Amborella trichopoda]|eukprot:XP_020522154.1 uncharacterized protein At4g33100 isoform X4 [Amborella trichopoda]